MLLGDIFHSGLQLMQVLGLVSIMAGVLLVLSGLFAGRGPIEIVKGATLMIFGVYVAGLAPTL